MELELVSECLICGSRALIVIDPECSISQCANCGYVFDNPRPVLRELVQFYCRPSKYDVWLQELDARDQVWKRRLKMVLRHRKQGSLLDVGTGIGHWLAVARPYFEEVHGTEVSATAIRIAKEKYGLGLFEETLEAIRDSGRRFDNISLFHVLEHVPDPASLLRTCHSLLSDNGILVIAVPNEIASVRGQVKRWLVHRGILKPRKGAGQFGLPRITLTAETNEVHLSHFTPSVLAMLLRRTRFSVLEQTLDPHYVRTTKTAKLKADILYYGCLAFQTFFRSNIYDAMLVIAQKEGVAEENQATAA